MDHGNNQTRSAIPQAAWCQLNRGRIRRLLGYKLHCAKGGWTSQDKYQGGYATHSVGLTWTPKIPNFYTVRAGIAVDNLTNKKYVSVTDSYGYARSFRAWLSAQF